MSALSSIGDCDESEEIFGRRGEGDDDDDDDAKATKSLALT